jgi:trk system potassium uptake protein TrkH
MRNRFQTTNVVLYYTGLILIFLGILLLVPLLFVIFGGETAQGRETLYAFLVPSALSFAIGFAFKSVFREGRPYTLRAMLICSMGWIACSAIGAVPFVIGIGAGYVDAYFETMSGFTTTGITMFSGLDEMPASILFWRSFTQGLGGIGILAFFLVLGYKGSDTHRLFGAESHKIDVDRPVPGMANTIKILWMIYAGFTLVIFLGLLAAGMPAFDSLCHCQTALSTGGYSPHDASIEFYRQSGHPHYVLIEYIVIAGMLMGGINFLTHFRVLTGKIRALFGNIEMKVWWGIIGACTAAMLLERYLRIDRPAAAALASIDFWAGLEENFRIVLFQVVSILTTTGFATRDIASPFFGSTAKQIFLVLMVIGGCVGSTGGGIKVLRAIILAKLLRRELFRLRSPRQAISKVMIDGNPVPAGEIQRASALFFTWIAMLATGGVITAFLSHHDPLSSFSGMFSALGNIGPCYISAGDMAQLSPAIKIVYIIGMLAGRLEILPVLMLLNPKAWKY